MGADMLIPSTETPVPMAMGIGDTRGSEEETHRETAKKLKEKLDKKIDSLESQNSVPCEEAPVCVQFQELLRKCLEVKIELTNTLIRPRGSERSPRMTLTSTFQSCAQRQVQVEFIDEEEAADNVSSIKAHFTMKAVEVTQEQRDHQKKTVSQSKNHTCASASVAAKRTEERSMQDEQSMHLA
ncbi:hypothetical protein Bbelb_036550 [Branchiostoma belcheri]|nr:hypothetical protein Bbelb_036550 [Branchiostoma belcheri]